MVSQAIQIVLSIFLIIGTGMVLCRAGWLKEEHAPLLSRLVVKVGLPALIINNMFTSFSRDSLLEGLPGLAVPLLAIAISVGLSRPLGRLFRVPENRRGVFSCMFGFSNSVFIGVPISTALFGEAAMPYTLMYYITNTFLFWTLGNALMRRDGATSGVQKEKLDFSRSLEYFRLRARFFLKKGEDPAKDEKFVDAIYAHARVRKLFPLPLVTFFACFLLVLTGLRLPSFLLSATKYIGSIVTPLSLFYTSILLVRLIRAHNVRWSGSYLLVFLGRFVVCPGLVYLLNLAYPLPELMRNVLIVQAAMPVMAQTPIVAGELGSDPEYAAGGLVLSTLCCIASIPIYMAML